MAKSRNRGKKYDKKRSQRRWLTGFSIVYKSASDECLPCWRGKINDAAHITWNANHEAIKSKRFNWLISVWVEFDHGDGKPYREHGEFTAENSLLDDLTDNADELKAELMGEGNEKFQTDYGWSATILPDAANAKNSRRTMADRLERLIAKG